MDYLDKLESKSIYIIREAYNQFKDIAILWSAGKDSTVLLWLCKEAFYGKIPFPAIYIDTGKHFKEMYDFRDKAAKDWELDLIISKNSEADKNGIGPKDKLDCCGARKTEALKNTIKEKKFDALLLGIRRDEHGIRAKERVFSPRNIEFKWDYKNQPPEMWDQYKSRVSGEEHIRVHPLLHWTELDIWKYILKKKLPVIDLYFSKNGKRYRSLGCSPCTNPIESNITDVESMIKEIEESKEEERGGRAQDKESAYMMQKLRALGYM